MEHHYSRKLGDDDPVIGHNWYDAITYCRWLTLQSPLGESSQCYDNPAKLPKESSDIEQVVAWCG